MQLHGAQGIIGCIHTAQEWDPDRDRCQDRLKWFCIDLYISFALCTVILSLMPLATFGHFISFDLGFGAGECKHTIRTDTTTISFKKNKKKLCLKETKTFTVKNLDYYLKAFSAPKKFMEITRKENIWILWCDISAKIWHNHSIRDFKDIVNISFAFWWHQCKYSPFSWKAFSVKAALIRKAIITRRRDCYGKGTRYFCTNMHWKVLNGLGCENIFEQTCLFEIVSIEVA